MVKKIALILVVALCCGELSAQMLRGRIIPPPVECEAGYEKGVSAQFGGVAAGAKGAIVAGGANFAGVAAAKGGKKSFYKGIYILKDDKWRIVGQMEQAAAYGGSVCVGDKLIFIGGANENGALATSHIYHTDTLGRMVMIEKLPNLPEPIEQCGAVVIDSTIYVVGGLASGQPSDKIYRLDLKSKEWQLLAAKIPAPVIQPVVVSMAYNIYIWGGFSLPTTVYDTGWRFNVTDDSWAELPAPPTGNMTGASAVVVDKMVVVSGGVNGAIFQSALNRRHKLLSATGAERDKLLDQDRKYMSMPVKEYKFNQNALVYDPDARNWMPFLDASQKFARAGALLLFFDRKLLIIGGETKPGIRSAKSWLININ